jgi:undecaprenyl pyrophosphate phosphatase UppP
VSLLNIAVPALRPGLTERPPANSSAHLILIPAITGWRDQPGTFFAKGAGVQ